MRQYEAKAAYQHERAAKGYEKRSYYRGLLGRIRRAREREAVRAAIQQFERVSTILDCPCGNGRWFPFLSRAAARLIGVDISKTMVQAASHVAVEGTTIEVENGDAESLNLPSRSVDHVFSYALMKHLPMEVKRTVLHEFARVSRGRLAISFAIFTPLSYAVWRMRGARGYPIWWSQLEALARAENLTPTLRFKVGLPVIGMETLVVFERVPQNV